MKTCTGDAFGRHEEVFFKGEKCPLCQMLAVHGTQVCELLDEITRLEGQLFCGLESEEELWGER
uniref:Uncharacterized protein n=1 Tax=viral metagenome TaxID=1070528 RepID=A0A6M3IQK0_9ZZZZ